MTVRELEKAIGKVQTVVQEWDDLGATWREDHTRYAIIDPIIRALGWNTADPKECHPEFPRGRTSTQRVDYALFAQATAQEIYEGYLLPDIIIEAKSLREDLEEAVAQLRQYVRSAPQIKEGYGVLTNGCCWWIYDLSKAGRFTDTRFEVIDILHGQVDDTAKRLDEHLGRPHGLRT
jgi:hypothetical protein